MFTALKVGLSALCTFLIASAAFAGDRPGFLFINATVGEFGGSGASSQALSQLSTTHEGQRVISGMVGHDIEVLAGSPLQESLSLVRFNSLADVEKFWRLEGDGAVAQLQDGAGSFDVLGLEGTGIEPYAPVNGVQPAYLFTLLKVKNREKLPAYIEAVGAYATTGSNRIIAASQPDKDNVLEGDMQEWVIEIASWPSLQAIKDFISDPRFAGASALRNEAMDLVLLAVEVPDAAN